MKKISVVISAFNEEKNIKDCLESVKWADEIILVDNSSTDKTVQIARQYTRKIYNRPNLVMLNKNKNFGFTKATGEWILNLDADERVTPALAEEILAVITKGRSGRNDPGSKEPHDPGSKEFRIERPLPESPPQVGYEMPRKNIIFGKWIEHGLW